MFADVWKGNHNGREVAAKALRVYRTSDFDEIRKVNRPQLAVHINKLILSVQRFCKEVIAWRVLRHPNVLPLLGVTMEDKRFVMVSEWMKNGNIIDFLKGKNTGRLELVRPVSPFSLPMTDDSSIVAARGGYEGVGLHARSGNGPRKSRWGMCFNPTSTAFTSSRRHKRNIMIDDNGCAVVAGFGLITLVPSQSILLSSCMDAGAVRWMSPELLNPGKFGLSGSQQTKESDCYALGMVAYEILSGCAPFGTNGPFTVLRKVTDGEHPERPQGEAGKLFTDGIWDILGCCWEAEPRVRASAKDVLRCLDGNSPITDRGDGESDAVSTDSSYVGLDDPGDSAGRFSLSCPKYLVNHQRVITGLSTASNGPKPLDLAPPSPISGPPGPVVPDRLPDSLRAGLFEGRMD